MVAAFEVPVEAALGDAQPLTQRGDLNAANVLVDQQLVGVFDPVFSGQLRLRARRTPRASFELWRISKSINPSYNTMEYGKQKRSNFLVVKSAKMRCSGPYHHKPNGMANLGLLSDRGVFCVCPA